MQIAYSGVFVSTPIYTVYETISRTVTPNFCGLRSSQGLLRTTQYRLP